MDSLCEFLSWCCVHSGRGLHDRNECALRRIFPLPAFSPFEVRVNFLFPVCFQRSGAAYLTHCLADGFIDRFRANAVGVVVGSAVHPDAEPGSFPGSVDICPKEQIFPAVFFFCGSNRYDCNAQGKRKGIE